MQAETRHTVAGNKRAATRALLTFTPRHIHITFSQRSCTPFEIRIRIHIIIIAHGLSDGVHGFYRLCIVRHVSEAWICSRQFAPPVLPPIKHIVWPVIHTYIYIQFRCALGYAWESILFCFICILFVFWFLKYAGKHTNVILHSAVIWNVRLLLRLHFQSCVACVSVPVHAADSQTSFTNLKTLCVSSYSAFCFFLVIFSIFFLFIFFVFFQLQEYWLVGPMWFYAVNHP